jgi:hypothetical protein
MKNILKNPFAGMQKVTVATLCLVCITGKCAFGQIADDSNDKYKFFIEWDAKVSYNDSEISNYNNQISQFAFGISPKAGYWLTDNFAVGTSVSYSILKTKFDIKNPLLTTNVSESIRSEYGFLVFGRYKIQLPKSFSLFLESSLGVRSLIEKEKMDALTKKIGSTFFTDIIIFPAISYNITDRFSIVTTCEFLNLGIHLSNTKIEDTGQKTHNNVIGLNTQSAVFSSLGSIKLGFIYNF